MNRFSKLGQYGIFLAFALICVVLALSTPKFFTVSNLLIIGNQVSINALLAFGVTFVIITGGIDLSLGSMVAVTGVAAASFAHPDTYPLAVPLLVWHTTEIVPPMPATRCTSMLAVPPFSSRL